MVANFNPFANTEVGKVELTLCNIVNPSEISQVFPVHSSRGGPCAQWPQTWRNPGKPISEMSANSLSTQEEKINKTTLKMLPGLGSVNLSINGQWHLTKAKISGGISEDLDSLWEIVKNDSPAYRKIASTFIASNADAGGRLLKCHLKKYWKSGSPDAYKSVFNSLRGFLDFQKSRNEPAREWGSRSDLIFCEHRRWILLE